MVLENLWVTGFCFHHLVIHFDTNDEAEELVLILAFRSWLLVSNHDWRLPKISPQTVGIFYGTSSTAAATRRHDGIVAPQLKIGTLGGNRLLGICQDEVNGHGT